MQRHTGQRGSDETIASLLSLTRVVVLDPDGKDKPNALTLLKTAVVADPADAERAWIELVSECQRLAEERSGADRAAFRRVLLSRRIHLRGVPELAGDVQRLGEFTQETLSSLSHLAHLDVPVGSGAEDRDPPRRQRRARRTGSGDVDCSSSENLARESPAPCFPPRPV